MVLDPGLLVQIGNRSVEANPGDEFIVSAEEPHRIKNVGDERGRVLEVAYGYTTEEDTFRLQDDYGRPLEPDW
ncbi:MAG: cupin domain-containing protein [Actinobacteria bacterium]|nr:MAG: cupin domain-containing protein [Actinomycetota bacterium]